MANIFCPPICQGAVRVPCLPGAHVPTIEVRTLKSEIFLSLNTFHEHASITFSQGIQVLLRTWRIYVQMGIFYF